MSIKDPATHVPDFDLEAPRPEAQGLPSVAEQVGKVPTEPGCYLWKDAKGEVVYVGKAKNLRARMLQYVRLTDDRAKIPLMMQVVRSFDYIVVGSEHEALVLEWYGRMPAGPNPVANWILACERHHPDLVPTEYGQPLRPITGAAREYLLSAENNERYMTLREGTLLGDIDFRLPTLVERSGPGYLLSVNPQGAYSASCSLLWQRARERMGLGALRRFFTNMGRGLGAEFATGQFLTGYASVSGLAEWTPGAAQRHSPQLGRDDELLGLPSVASWWVWLGPDYARVVSGWLERGVPSSWVVEETGDGGVLVQTSAEPTGYEAGAGQWFPEEFLPTVGPVPRRRLVDWLLGTRPRAQVGPARVMPTWTRPTTDTNAEGTNGPDADAGTAHNPITGPGADGTTGPDADAGTAHNPATGPGAGETAGPDTRPGADAPGPPRT